MDKEKMYVPVQCIPMNANAGEIDLRDLFKTLFKHKVFIFLFVLIITSLSILYTLFIAKPVYEIKSYIEPGYINSYLKDKIEKNYIINPNTLKIEINSNFDNSKNTQIHFPIVNSNIVKDTNIIEIKIQQKSNDLAKKDLDRIFKYIKSKEKPLISSYSDNIKNQIEILSKSKASYTKEIEEYKQKLGTTKDSRIFQSLLDTISKDKELILNITNNIERYKSLVSPINIKTVHYAGKILMQESPIKPKKKLIVIVSFITSFILSIFLVFFIEFIKSFKEEK